VGVELVEGLGHQVPERDQDQDPSEREQGSPGPVANEQSGPRPKTFHAPVMKKMKPRISRAMRMAELRRVASSGVIRRSRHIRRSWARADVAGVGHDASGQRVISMSVTQALRP
jgi:hypothetical protein